MVYLRYYIVELVLVEYMRLLYRAFIKFVVKDPNFCMHTFSFSVSSQLSTSSYFRPHPHEFSTTDGIRSYTELYKRAQA